MKKYRKFVTSGVGFSFFVVGLTGVIFKLFFKNHVLEEIHGWIGLAMVAAAIAHIAQHWGPLRNHFRDWRVFLLLVPIVLAIAIIAFGDDGGSDRRGERIDPRAMIHKLAAGNVGDVAKAFGKDVNTVFASMKSEGLQVGNSGETVEQLAHRNQKSAEGILAFFLN